MKTVLGGPAARLREKRSSTLSASRREYQLGAPVPFSVGDRAIDDEEETWKWWNPERPTH